MTEAQISLAATADDEQDEPAAMLVAADIVLFGADDGRLRLLTVQRRYEPHQGCWALPGGLLDDETLPQAAVRELAEETGIHIEVDDLIEIGSSSTPDRDPRQRVLSVAYAAILPTCPAPVAGDDAQQARWVLLDAVLDDPDSVAFDHHQIVARATERLREQLRRAAPGPLPVVTTINAAAEAFVAAVGEVDQDAYGTELGQLRKRELHALLAGLDAVRGVVADLVEGAHDEAADFIGSHQDLEAVSASLEEAGAQLDSVIDFLRA